MEGSILGIKIKDKIRNTKIWCKTNTTAITKLSFRLKWEWTGHLIRDDKDKWAKRTTVWIPRDKKRKRNPQDGWTTLVSMLVLHGPE